MTHAVIVAFRAQHALPRRWSPEEIAWGRECLTCGDSVEEIAEGAGCIVREVIANIGPGSLNELQRDVVSLYAAGRTFAEIDQATGRTRSRVPGKAAAAMVTQLRKRGHRLPYRNHVEELRA